jgi:hypothetical protein
MTEAGLGDPRPLELRGTWCSERISVCLDLSGLTSTMETKQAIVKKVNVHPDDAWAAIRQFGRLDVWFPSMSACRIEGEGVGAVRHLTLDGGLGEITDHLVFIDDEERRLTYRRTESPFPVTSYVGNVEVFKSFDSLTVVVWTVDFESAPDVSELVAELLRDGISAGLDGMEADLAAVG